MAANTKIEWAHHTQNFWVGCTKVSAACDFCYAESWAKRAGRAELWQGKRDMTKTWKAPLRWNAEAARRGIRYNVFCNSLSDFFDNQVEEWIRDAAWETIEHTKALTWMILTKRPQNIPKMLPKPCSGRDPWPWPNVWLGTTVENQEEADRRIPLLLKVPARLHFLSCEPLLGSVDLRHVAPTEDGYTNALSSWVGSNIGWVIAGGESGAKARPMHPAWPRDIRDQCAEANVPFFFKQHGEWVFEDDLTDEELETKKGPVPTMFVPSPVNKKFFRVGKARAGRLLDRREHNDVPKGSLIEGS